MKIPFVQRITKDDLSRAGDLPKWIDELIDPLNLFIDQVGQALQANLDFLNNFYGTEVTFTLTHGSAQSYAPPAGKRVKGIVVIDSGGQVVSGAGFVRNSDGSIAITVHFAAGAKTASSCLIQVQWA